MTGTSLPQTLIGIGNSVPHGNSFILAGARGRDIMYKYDPETGHWILLPQRLSSAPAYGAIPISIDRDDFNSLI